MRIRMVNLTKIFSSIRGKVVALEDINLEIKDSEFFVLLGPSGCGKSTLLNLVAGLEKPTSGEIWFADKLVASSQKKIFLTPKERNVAMVFQSYALYPHLNVFENIAFPLRIQKTKDSVIKEKVIKAAEMVGISDLLNAKPAELSGGQRQRVAIARAIVRKPDVFLLDEPLSNLDAQLRMATRTELKQLQQSLGTTTIYVTHDQVEAMTLGDRVAVLRNGKIEQVGTPEELYNNPVNPFVATFIGLPPMNLIEATIVEENKEYFAVIDGNKLKIPVEKQRDIVTKNKKLILGIRPEDIYISSDKKENIFETKIISVEPLGRELIIYVLLGNQKISVLSTNKELKKNQMLLIEFNISKIHLFN